MKISVNGSWMEVTEEESLQQFTEKLLPAKLQGIAIAVNAAVIPKATWPSFMLSDRDELLIIEAAQGG